MNGFSALTTRIVRLKKHLINDHLAVVTITFLVLTIGLGSFLRFYHIGTLSFWLDEAAEFTYSGGSLINLVTAIKNDPNMSLYDALAFFWIRIFPGASDGTLRALSAIFSVASIPVVFLLGRTMVADRREAIAIGLIAAFLITVNAFHVQYAQEFRSYSLTFLLTTFSTLFFINGIEEIESKRHWLIGYTIISAAAVYSHLYAVFIVVAQVLTLPILLLDKNRHYFEFKRILYSCIGMAWLILPIAVLAYLDVPEGILGIPGTTLGTIKSFSKLITGNQGEGLFVFYLLFGCIGLVYGEGVGFQQDHITRWKFTLIASCLFVPVLTSLVISFSIAPIFTPKYVLYIMPYLAVLAATGLVALVSFGWRKNKKYRYFFVLVGIGVLVLFAMLSTIGVQTYYENYQKTDWRKATQFLTTRCSESLRLYYAPYIDISVLYYNPALNSQKEDWWINVLKNNPDADELAAVLPNEYSQVCLVLAHAIDQNQQKIVQAAIQKKYPNVSTFKFYWMEIDIYNR